MLFRSFLLVAAFILADCWRPFKISMYNPETSVYNSSVADFNITITNSDTITVYFNVLQQLQNPQFHIEYILESGNEKDDLVLGNKTYDICAFLKNRKIDVVLQLFVKIADRFGDWPKRCPFQKKLYYLKNMKFDSEYLPLFLPDNKGYSAFSLASKIEKKSITLINGKVSFKVERTFKGRKN